MGTIESRIRKLQRLFDSENEFEIPININEMNDSEVDAVWNRYMAHIKKNNTLHSIKSEILRNKTFSEEEIGLINELFANSKEEIE